MFFRCEGVTGCRGFQIMIKYCQLSRRVILISACLLRLPQIICYNTRISHFSKDFHISHFCDKKNHRKTCLTTSSEIESLLCHADEIRFESRPRLAHQVLPKFFPWMFVRSLRNKRKIHKCCLNTGFFTNPSRLTLGIEIWLQNIFSIPLWSISNRATSDEHKKEEEVLQLPDDFFSDVCFKEQFH